VNVSELYLWLDDTHRPAGANMALDEALFSWTVRTGRAAARFYCWDHDAETIGYFSEAKEGAIRRFTGGGLVEHGKDVTFALTFPAGSAPSPAGSGERYRRIHEALANALHPTGIEVQLMDSGDTSRGGPCFSHAVPWDLVDPVSGEKICGGAQRRSRGAIIHQGSVRLPVEWRSPSAKWITPFLSGLTKTTLPLPSEEIQELQKTGTQLERARYLTKGWNDGSVKML
jgi:lipoate-protein ligase A